MVQNVQDNLHRLQNEQIYDKTLSHNKLIIDKKQSFQELIFTLVNFDFTSCPNFGGRARPPTAEPPAQPHQADSKPG